MAVGAQVTAPASVMLDREALERVEDRAVLEEQHQDMKAPLLMGRHLFSLWEHQQRTDQLAGIPAGILWAVPAAEMPLTQTPAVSGSKSQKGLHPSKTELLRERLSEL